MLRSRRGARRGTRAAGRDLYSQPRYGFERRAGCGAGDAALLRELDLEAYASAPLPEQLRNLPPDEWLAAIAASRDVRGALASGLKRDGASSAASLREELEDYSAGTWMSRRVCPRPGDEKSPGGDK